MPDYCTLMCAKSDPALAFSTLSKFVTAGRDALTVEGKPEDWRKMTVVRDGATIVVNSLKPQAGSREFSRLIMGMHSYFRKIATPAAAVKEDVLKRVSQCRYALGVVAEPEFVDDANHFDYIFGLAEALDALIWNGSGVIDIGGRIVLESTGNSEMA